VSPSTLLQRESASADGTEAVGRELAGLVAAGDVVLLEGDLAAGKTTLVRGLLAGLGGDPDDVTSPTFVLLQPYRCRERGVATLYHVDLYRLGNDPATLREIGLEEILSDQAGLVAVEWPRGALARWVPADARVWRVVITVGDGDERVIEVIVRKG
jgi:tRNA threonylcarbamoyladenosine biosynthesis protein TsaE